MQILIRPRMLHTCSTFQHKAGETGREWNGERQMRVATVTDEAPPTRRRRRKWSTTRGGAAFALPRKRTLLSFIWWIQINYILFSNLGFLDTWSQDTLDPLHTANLMFYTVLQPPVQVYPVFCPMTAGLGSLCKPELHTWLKQWTSG